jgi:23S rRNA (cytidine1920-2'-O)/16S rRNA (cytidine1409-2'-O)-methyltransferase
MRLDIYLVENGFCSSRNKAKDLLLRGGVKVNGVIEYKPSLAIYENDKIEVLQDAMMPFVSKGGVKLEKAIKTFDLDFQGKYVIDIGASTGGFTDCALKHGAKFVWAVDVGSAQLVRELREDERVLSVENTDFRHLSPTLIGTKVDFVVGDLSFISLSHILEYIPQFLKANGCVVLLIKPQFEVGPKNINKGGIVKDSKLHIKAIQKVVNTAVSCGLYLTNITTIPIVDAKKNVEYLACFKMASEGVVDIRSVVDLT